MSNNRSTKIWTLLAVMALCLTVSILFVLPVAAQTSTVVPTVAAPTSAVTTFFVACDTQVVMNATGTMLANFDIYYQVFSGAGGTGTAITGLRQLSVAGDFSVSETAPYNSGSTVAAGTIASARVVVARETNSNTIDFEFTVDDVQDGCATPQYAQVTGADTGANAVSTSGSTAASGVRYGINRSVLGPNGTTLNPNLQAEAAVVVGARQSDRYRSETPGLIFAECFAFPLALPGIIYDTDGVTIFWSWYTKTLAQMEEHLANALYRVELNTAALPMTQRSEPVLRDGNYWVFYTANVGNLRPGHYEVGYSLNWSTAVNDGYSDYGPGTGTPFQNGLCNFDVTPNPTATSVVYNGMYFPTLFPVHNINTD